MLIARYFGWGKGSLAKNRDAPIAWRDVLLTDFVLKCDCAFCLQTFRHWPIIFDLIRLLDISKSWKIVTVSRKKNLPRKWKSQVLLSRPFCVLSCASSTNDSKDYTFNENCVHFCLNSTKGDVDLEERDGFLGFSIPSMNPLDHIYSLSKGEMLLRYCWLFKETCNQTLWFIQMNGRLTNKTKGLWVSINKRWINRSTS